MTLMQHADALDREVHRRVHLHLPSLHLVGAHLPDVGLAREVLLRLVRPEVLAPAPGRLPDRRALLTRQCHAIRQPLEDLIDHVEDHPEER